MRPDIKGIFNFDSPDVKRALMRSIGTLGGMYEIQIEPRRATRSLKQNAAYWSLPVAYFADFLQRQDYEDNTPEYAHGILAAKFLQVPFVDRNTGEVLGYRVRSTADLSTEEFADYFDKCQVWLADQFGIVVPDPDENWREASPKRREHAAT